MLSHSINIFNIRRLTGQRMVKQHTKDEDNAIWNTVVKNYELIEGVQLSNSFILLLVLDETNQALTTTQGLDIQDFTEG
jgi:hypothetical protein